MQQEMIIEKLNETACRQELEIEALKHGFAALKEHFVTMAPSVSLDPDQEDPPPHY